MKDVKNWTKDEAESFIIGCLAWIGMGFHPDTPMEDYVDCKSDKPTFTKREAKANQARLVKAMDMLGETEVYKILFKYAVRLGHGPGPDEDKGAFILEMVYGTEAVGFCEGGMSPAKAAKDGDGMHVRKIFNTEAERDAYLEGVDDMDGWDAWLVVEQ